MMKMRFFPYAFAILSCFSFQAGLAQDSETLNDSKWAIQLSVQQQDLVLRIPYGQLGTVYPVYIRPFYSLDVQRTFHVNDKHELFWSAQLGYYNNLYHEKWISGKMGIGIEKKLFARGFTSLRVEGGLARAKSSDVQYIYESGKWVPTDNFSKASIDILMAPRLDLGYNILDGDHKLDVVVTSQLLLHLDTSIESGLPMYGVGLGLRYHL